MLIVIRGLPGAGKSTQATHIFEYYYDKDRETTIAICSNNLYPGYYENGKYIWTPEKANEARKFCQESFNLALQKNTDIIILDNTNLSPSKYRPYVELAERAHHQISYCVFRPPLENPTALREYIEVCYQRNTHGLSLQTITEMAKSWVD